MTPKCPKCSTELSDDYGMVTCPSCGAIVFVDMEGMAHVAGDEPPAESNPLGESPAITPSQTAEPASPFENLAPMDIGTPDISPLEPFSTEPAPMDAGFAEPEIFPETAPAAPEAPAEPPPDDQGEVDMNAFLGYSDPASATAPASQNDPNDPLGISAYANSEISSAKDGPLVVTLIISGIDAKDLRDEIRQALQDSRFGWDASALMSSIKGGVLKIDRVSPVKATIIVNRIKHLSVRIRWEQNAITEIDPLEKEP